MGNQRTGKYNDEHNDGRRDVVTSSTSFPRKSEDNVYSEVGVEDEATEHDSRDILHLFGLEALDHDNHCTRRQGRESTEVLNATAAADISNNLKGIDAHHGQETMFERRDALFPISTPLSTKSLTSSSILGDDDVDVEVDEMETDSWWNSSQQTTIPEVGDEDCEVVDPNKIVSGVGEVVGYVSNESSPEQKDKAIAMNDVGCGFQNFQESLLEESMPVVGFQKPMSSESDFLDEPKRFNFAAVAATQRERQALTLSETFDSRCRPSILDKTLSKVVLDEGQSSDASYSHQLNAIEIELAGLTAQHRNSNRKLLWDDIEDAASTALRYLIAEIKAQPRKNSKNLVLLLVRPHVMAEFRLQQRAARMHLLARSEKIPRRYSHDLVSQHPTSFAMTERKSGIILRNTVSSMMEHQMRPTGEEKMELDFSSTVTKCRSSTDPFRSVLHATNSIDVKIVLKGLRWGVPLPSLVSSEVWEENTLNPTS